MSVGLAFCSAAASVSAYSTRLDLGKHRTSGGLCICFHVTLSIVSVVCSQDKGRSVPLPGWHTQPGRRELGLRRRHLLPPTQLWKEVRSSPGRVRVRSRFLQLQWSAVLDEPRGGTDGRTDATWEDQPDGAEGGGSVGPLPRPSLPLERDLLCLMETVQRLPSSSAAFVRKVSGLLCPLLLSRLRFPLVPAAHCLRSHRGERIFSSLPSSPSPCLSPVVSSKRNTSGLLGV